MSAFSFPPNSAAWAAARSLCDAVVEPRRTREVGNHRQTEQERIDRPRKAGSNDFCRLWDAQFKWEWLNICPQGTLEGWKEGLPECEGGVFEKRGETCCQKLESFKGWLQKLHLTMVLCWKCGFKPLQEIWCFTIPDKNESCNWMKLCSKLNVHTSTNYELIWNRWGNIKLRVYLFCGVLVLYKITTKTCYNHCCAQRWFWISSPEIMQCISVAVV